MTLIQSYLFVMVASMHASIKWLVSHISLPWRTWTRVYIREMHAVSLWSVEEIENRVRACMHWTWSISLLTEVEVLYNQGRHLGCTLSCNHVANISCKSHWFRPKTKLYSTIHIRPKGIYIYITKTAFQSFIYNF